MHELGSILGLTQEQKLSVAMVREASELDSILDQAFQFFVHFFGQIHFISRELGKTRLYVHLEAQ